MSTVRKGVLDTSAVIDVAQADPETLPTHPLITAITLAELSVGPHTAQNDDERVIRQQRLQWVESAFQPLPFDADAARAFAGIAVALRRSGRKPAARAYDGLIAAIAMSNGLPVHTANAKDFRGIPDLEVIEVRPA